MSNAKVAIVGCGLWGRNLVRNFYNLNALHTVCDLDIENLNIIKNDFSDIKTTSDFSSLLNNPEISGIIIATPSHTHYKMVKAALNAGKNVYVEKPIATLAQEARELTDLAEEKELVLMVGHLLLYHPVVNRLKTIVKEGTLGDIKYVQSDRLNVNYFKNDRSVMWDLAPHDLSMIGYIIDKEPLSVKNAVGCSTDGNGIMDIVHLDINFEDGIHAHISDSWINPAKSVVLTVRGTKATAVFDDTLPENKLHIYDNSSPNKQVVESPDYLEIEPLKLECQHFLNSIINKVKPRSDGNNGYQITKILEEADKIMLGSNKECVDNFEFAASRRKVLN